MADSCCWGSHCNKRRFSSNRQAIDDGHRTLTKIGMGGFGRSGPRRHGSGFKKIYNWFFDFPLGVGVALRGILLANLGLKVALRD